MNKRHFLHVLSIALLVCVAATHLGRAPASAQPVTLKLEPGGPYTGMAGVPIQFSARAVLSTGQIVSADFVWNFGDGTAGSGPSPSHAYVNNGTYTVIVTAVTTDDYTATAITTAQIGAVASSSVVGQSRDSSLAVSAGGPYTGAVGMPVTFSAQATLNGVPVPDASFVWNFGDGGAGVGAGPTHRYSAAGVFTVIVTATTSAGLTARGSTVVHISGVFGDLGVNPGGPYVGTTGVPVVFTGEVLTATVNTTGLYYFWDFGDGLTGSGPTTTHTYATGGVFTVTLTVTAISGVTASASTIANISGATGAFTITAGGPYAGVPNQPVFFAAQAYLNEATPIAATYTWNFGNGMTGRGQVVSHAYVTEGTYTVTVTATTSTGQSGTATTTVQVSRSTTEPVQLTRGCNLVTSNWPTGTAPATLAQAVTPTGIVQSVWRFDPTRGYFVGYSIQPATPNDLQTVERGTQVLICLSAPGTLAEPIL